MIEKLLASQIFGLFIGSLFFSSLIAEEMELTIPKGGKEILAQLSAKQSLELLAKKAEENEEEVVHEPVLVVEEQPVLNIIENQRVALSKGTFFIHGSGALVYKITGFSYTQHAFSLKSKVGVGYFLKDHLAVGANIPSTIKFYPGLMGEIGLSLFSTYFFAINRVFYPYFGGDLTPRYSVQERSFLLSGGVNVGLLLSLSGSVALDFGIEPELYFRLNNQQKWMLELPVGFIGVRAFF